MIKEYLRTARKQFEYYKGIGERTFAQLDDEQLFYQPAPECNSIAVIVQHLHGNMMSRWTDFLTTDGEKEWRRRDEEFEPVIRDRLVMMDRWNEGWSILLSTLDPFGEEDFEKIVRIRNEEHTVIDAINRQLAHYPYHVGQIVYIGMLCLDKSWQSLSIPKNRSREFNQEKFGRPQ